MQIYISVLSAIVSARILEWVAIATVKTIKEKQDQKAELLRKLEAIKRTDV